MANNSPETRTARTQTGGGANRFRAAQSAWLVGAVGLALLSFVAGRFSAAPAVANASTEPVEAASAPGPFMTLVQDLRAQPDARELIPMPQPGEQAGPPAEAGECPLYLYEDGQLFRFDSPGSPGGPPPGSEGSPELFPLEPLPRPPTPAPLPPDRPQEPSPPDLAPGELIVGAEGPDRSAF